MHWSSHVFLGNQSFSLDKLCINTDKHETLNHMKDFCDVLALYRGLRLSLSKLILKLQGKNPLYHFLIKDATVFTLDNVSAFKHFCVNLALFVFFLTVMAFLFNHRLAFLVMLMTALHLESTSAAVEISGLRAKYLSGDIPPNAPDPYVKVWCGNSFGGMTEFRRDQFSPKWSAKFSFTNCRMGDTLKLEVWDKDLSIDDHLFTCVRKVARRNEDVTCSTSSGTLYYTYKVY